MDIEKIKNIIISSFDSQDVNYLINNMSLEERLYLINNEEDIFSDDRLKNMNIDNINFILFSFDEINEYIKDWLNNSNNDFITKNFEVLLGTLVYYESMYGLEMYDKYIPEDIGKLFNAINDSFYASDSLIGDYIKLLKDEDKIKILDYLNGDYEKVYIISNLDSEELKRNYLVRIESVSDRLDIILNIENDNIKKDCLNLLDSQYSKLDVIKTINDEDVMLECLEIAGLDEEMKINFIKTLDSDKIKLHYLYLLVRLYTNNGNFNKKEFIENNFSTDNGIRLVTSKLDKYDEVFKEVNGLIDLDDFLKHYDFFREEKNIEKVKLLFDRNNFIMNKSDLDSVLESFILKDFKLRNSDIWNIFSRLKFLMEEKEIDVIKKEIFYILKYTEKTKNYIGKDLLNFLEEYKQNNNMLDKFIEDLMNRENNDKYNLAMEKLRKITTQYINLEIENYKSEKKEEVYEIINYNKKIEKNYLIKNVTEMNTYDVLLALICRYYSHRVNDDIKEALKYKVSNPEKAPIEVKRNFKELNNIFIDLYNNHYDVLLAYMKPNNISLKYEKNFVMDNSTIKDNLIKRNMKHIIELCSGIDDKKFNIIVDFIKKYHLFAFSYTFNNKILSQIGVNIDLDFMISKLNKLDNIDIENINLLDFLASFCDQDKLLKYLIDEENKDNIISNPAPNSAAMDTALRKEKVGSYIVDMYKKDKVNVPAMDVDYCLSNGKIVNVNVGNFTNSINLTYGERTGSCMRIGGAGADLFDFCLNNKAGIHIRFSTKKGEFISRISGFRVGNTLFLNELRESVHNEVSNSDLVEYSKRVAKEIISNTKDSKYPIENVVVSNLYALSKEGIIINLNVVFFRDGEKVPKYYDVDTTRCLLLATSNKEENKEFVPFRDTPMDEYDVLRDKIIYLENDEDIHMMINRLKLINQLLGGASQKDLVIEESDKEYKWGYFGEDFYVVMDKDNNIETYYMCNSKNVEKAKEEMKELLNTLKKGVDYNELDNNASYSRGVINFLMIIITLWVFLMIVIVMM